MKGIVPTHSPVKRQAFSRSSRRFQMVLGSAGAVVLCSVATLIWRGATETRAPSAGERPRGLQELLALDDAALSRLDPIEADLAIARTIPGCESLDVPRYQRTVDQWAGHVREETNRHLYRFQQSPGEYRNSLAYFKALVLATVIGQDFGVGYHVESIAFDDPRDLFIHGVIDGRRGTCVSLPVLYMAIGHRLGYPIKAVTVPRHLFCRWDDPQTGERFNIEAANAGGLADYPDEHYRSWPTKLDSEDVETGGALKTLTMREFLAVKIAARGDYYWHKGQRPEAQVSYALAHQLYPANRTIYETLAGQVLEEAERYPWSSLANIARRSAASVTVRPASRPSDGGAS